jgi:hypothetical protein
VCYCASSVSWNVVVACVCSMHARKRFVSVCCCASSVSWNVVVACVCSMRVRKHFVSVCCCASSTALCNVEINGRGTHACVIVCEFVCVFVYVYGCVRLCAGGYIYYIWTCGYE